MDYQIKQILFADIPISMRKDAEKERITFINKDGAFFWGAYIGYELVGISAIFISKNGNVKLKSSFVYLNYRGNGIFNALHIARLAFCKSKGVKKITVNCTSFSKNTHLRFGAKPYKQTKTITYMEYPTEVSNG